MNKFVRSTPYALTVFVALASTAMAAPQTGVAAFVSEGRTYQASYAARNQAISVTIDGIVYRGNYAAHAKDSSLGAGDAPVGKWGRAFLFASSAKVLQCQLDSGFPRVSGRCQGADGRNFDLKPGARVKRPRSGSAAARPSS
ncbi:MAG TPA: hypothetical protein VE934_15690 [Polaromonas sp.]|uniref:hypothetical protein n=1 Tax=Polaromonas sp. TaxID=1869339 RepID=UPI002D52095D|nr:hypothetical protein [Polaromonas sp.]HYW58399.1 hypothetical protein [Polaromonas sp.]